jgi:hypothetical protein
MKKSVSLCLLIFLAATLLPAQDFRLTPTVISSGGGYFEGDNISLSWTLGELAVSTLSSANLVLTQGFQQPFDIDVGIRDREVNWGISVYPNPVGDRLSIRFDTRDPGDFLLEVQDVTGRLVSLELQRNVNPGDIIELNTSTFATGIYFLKVLTPDRQQIQVTSLRKL